MSKNEIIEELDSLQEEQALLEKKKMKEEEDLSNTSARDEDGDGDDDRDGSKNNPDKAEDKKNKDDLEEKKSKKSMKKESKEDDSEDDEDEDEDDAKDSKASMKEHLDAIFNGEDLSEDFKERVSNIFGVAVATAVNEQLEKERLELNKVFEEAIEEKITSLEENFENYKTEYSEEIETKLNEWTTHVVEEWKEENKVVLENNISNQISEDFISDLRSLMLEHNMDIPEAKVDVVEKLTEDLDALTLKVKELSELNESLKNEKEEILKEGILTSLAEGLSEIQKEKLEALTESLDYTSIEDFKTKVQDIKESYFTERKISTKEDDTDFEIQLEEQVEKTVVLTAGEKYARYLKNLR